MKTYAVGDVHGHLDALRAVLSWVERDAGDEETRVVFLGDYIDRGPDSPGVLSLLMAGPTRPGHAWVPLAGNHEQLMCLARSNDDAARVWLANGGMLTMQQFGKDGVPSSVLRWVMQLAVSCSTPRLAFAHAGMDPKRPVSDQKSEVLLWSRPVSGWDAPVRDEDGNPLLLVHGHTPVSKGFPPYRPGLFINLDTGVCFGGRLSVARWDEDSQHPLVAQYDVDNKKINVLAWAGTGWKVVDD